ncbi:hypothetical protein INT44_008209, partial [Umbelopsis vinacea]
MAIIDQFRHKTVCMLSCRFCSRHVCKRGMKAMLLADMTVELYSTDIPPSSGNVIGYHITMPCQVCLHSCNNGHFWMFRTEGVVSADRLNGIGKPEWGADCLWSSASAKLTD